MKRTLKNIYLILLVLWLTNGWAETPCDPQAPRSLDGSCNNLGFPSLGAVSTPLRYLTGQHYAQGDDEAIQLMREEALTPGAPNPYPYVPTSEAPEATCGPPGFVPECGFTIVPDQINGVGVKSKFNPRILSTALHAIDSPLAPPDGPQWNQLGLTNFFARFSQFIAHDLQLLDRTVTPRSRRHGLPNQSDPLNPTVLSGIPILDPQDRFNIVPTFTPAGVPEPPLHRSIIIPFPKPETYQFNRKTFLQFRNIATSFIDADNLYGRTREVLDKLRSHEGGKFLLTSLTSPQTGPFPPITVPGFPPSYAETGLRNPALIDGMEAYTPSYADARELGSIGLATIDILLLRFHNFQADRCRDRLPEADPLAPEGDEILFNCARKWTLAIYQHIVFDGFVPAMTGRQLPGYKGYNPLLSPQATVETILGAMPMHSIPTELSAIARPDGKVDDRLQVVIPGQPNPPAGYFPFVGSLFPTKMATAAFYLAMSGIPEPQGNPSNPSTPWVMTEDPVAQQVRGLAYFPHEANDMTVIDSMRHIPAYYGFDVVSNISYLNQKLGAGNYYQARRRFNSGWKGRIYGRSGCPIKLLLRDDLDDPVECFEIITEDHSKAQIIKEQLEHPLLGVKAKVKHIPLFSGLLMEPKVNNSILGFTARAIIEHQFRHARDSDRFYYRNQMSEQEIAEVESYSIAGVARAVLGDEVGIQDDLFHVPPPGFFTEK